MHSCLYITEILAIIFTSFDRVHLPVAARICRAWEKPALDVLWKSMDDLLPLVDLFPQDSRTLSLPRVCIPHFYGVPLTNQQGFTRPLVPSDFQCFNYYASRVHVCSFSHVALRSASNPVMKEITYKERVSQVQPSVFNTLAFHRQTLYILPRLRHLMLRGHTSPSLINSVLFLSPTLSQIRLHIDAEVSDQAVQTFFKTMEFYGQGNLRTFSFSHGRSGPFVSPITNALLSLLRCAQSLTKVTLTLSAVNTGVFAQLATMPHLVILRVNASRHSIAEAEVVILEQNNGAFPSLRELYLSNKSETCANIIQAVASPCLETIRLEISCYSVETLEAISKHSKTLRYLVVEVLDRERQPPQPDGHEVWFHPKQLLSCRALRVLSIISPNVLHITPSLLETMAKTWRLIQYLSLNPRPSAPPDSPPTVFNFNPFITSPTGGVSHAPAFPTNGVTLVCLETFTRETSIRHLGLIFDVCAPPVQGFNFKRDASDSASPLRTLDPGYSPLPEDTGPVSVAISKLFPNAVLGHDEDLSGKRVYFSRYFNKLAERWKQVNWIVKAMKEKRDQSKKIEEELVNEIKMLRAEMRKREGDDGNPSPQMN
jgi:hypothetical protein